MNCWSVREREHLEFECFVFVARLLNLTSRLCRDASASSANLRLAWLSTLETGKLKFDTHVEVIPSCAVLVMNCEIESSKINTLL